MTDDEVRSLGPDFEKDWARDFAPYPTRPVMLCGMVSAFLGDPSLVAPGQYFTMGTYTAYPYSRGSIHINSADDVLTGYDFDTGFLNHPSDIKKQLWAYKMTRDIARRLPFFEGELELGHPKFAESSKAALSAGGKEERQVSYSEEDDAAIEDWIRGNVNTTWHSLGTCAMKAAKDGGVVDQHLNVHGTSGLKVVDLRSVTMSPFCNCRLKRVAS